MDQLDKDGNDAADALAALAADAHLVPQHLAKHAGQRKNQAVALHTMMLGIVTSLRH